MRDHQEKYGFELSADRPAPAPVLVLVARGRQGHGLWEGPTALDPRCAAIYRLACVRAWVGDIRGCYPRLLPMATGVWLYT